MAKFYLVHSGQPQSSTYSGKRQQIAREQVLNLTNVERVLGVYEFVTGQAYSYCCRSIDLCLIQKLSRSKLSEILRLLGLTVLLTYSGIIRSAQTISPD